MKIVSKAAIAAITGLAAMFVVTAFRADAPPAGSKDPSMHARHARPDEDLPAKLTSALDLTEEQQIQMKALFVDTHAGMDTIRDDASLSKDDKMTRAKALHEEALAKLRTMLTADQQPKLDAFLEQHPMGPGMHHHGHEEMKDPVAHLTEALNLTPDQQTQLKAIFEDVHPQMRQIGEDKTLSPDDRKAKMKVLHEAAAGRINAILTPDQQQKFDELRKEMLHEHHD